MSGARSLARLESDRSYATPVMQPLIENDPDRLAAVIRAIGAGIVMLDGCTAAGKTVLARDLAERLQAGVVDVDGYIDRHQDTFVGALRVDELKSATEGALARSGIVFVSGICARDVADRAGLAPVLFVYVKRKTLAGVMADMDILDAEDGLFRRYRPGLEAEIAGYHRRRLPCHNADILYINIAD